MVKKFSNLRLVLWLEKLKASFWFWPAISLCFSIILSMITLHLDTYLGDSLNEIVPWIYGNQASGARSLLSTIAGSIMTVTGVTLSLTMLIVSHAASQHSPRLLENFMKHRVIQLALSTLVLTFTYCLLILRYVQEAIESNQTEAYIPHFSIFTALVLTAISLGVLFMFFNQVPENIKISNILNECGSELIEKINQHQSDKEETNLNSMEIDEVIQSIKTHHKKYSFYGKESGYIQTIDYECLKNLAEEYDVFIDLKVRVGEFSHRGVLFADIYSKSEKLSAEITQIFYEYFIIGRSRTTAQDMLFLADQLVEIIAKALSPGINDPRTANSAMDWLESASIEFFHMKFPNNLFLDSNKKPSLEIPMFTYEYVTYYIYKQVIPYASTDSLSSLHLMKIFDNSHCYLKDKKIPYYDILATELLNQSCENSLASNTLEELKRMRSNIVY